MDLEELRNRIDKIDKNIIDAIAERLAVANNIGLYKLNNNLKIEDKVREIKLINARMEYAKEKGINNEELIISIFEQLIKEAKEKQIRIFKKNM